MSAVLTADALAFTGRDIPLQYGRDDTISCTSFRAARSFAPASISIEIGTASVTTSLFITPDAAREFAADLLRAADAADGRAQ